jgi:hypothetical protein
MFQSGSAFACIEVDVASARIKLAIRVFIHTPVLVVERFFNIYVIVVLKFCTKCLDDKPSDQFYQRKSRDGYSHHCIECERKRMGDKRERNKLRIYALKEASPCKDCGLKYPHYVMDFDHIGDDKKSGLSELVNSRASWETILKEISKCDLICSNCHRVRTWNRIKR